MTQLATHTPRSHHCSHSPTTPELPPTPTSLWPLGGELQGEELQSPKGHHHRRKAHLRPGSCCTPPSNPEPCQTLPQRAQGLYPPEYVDYTLAPSFHRHATEDTGVWDGEETDMLLLCHSAAIVLSDVRLAAAVSCASLRFSTCPSGCHGHARAGVRVCCSGVHDRSCLVCMCIVANHHASGPLLGADLHARQSADASSWVRAPDAQQPSNPGMMIGSSPSGATTHCRISCAETGKCRPHGEWTAHSAQASRQRPQVTVTWGARRAGTRPQTSPAPPHIMLHSPQGKPHCQPGHSAHVGAQLPRPRPRPADPPCDLCVRYGPPLTRCHASA